ncbi:MAG: helix-turn-helix domain-containing protein [Gammaproteobacteria bacterium]
MSHYSAGLSCLHFAEQEWSEARRLAIVLHLLIESKHCPRNRVHESAVELGLSKRQVYRLIQRLRESGGELTAYCRMTPMAGGENRDWPHHAKNCYIA